jgi:hypothetical protein
MGFPTGALGLTYIQRVIAGQVPNAFIIQKFGANEQVDTAQAADIWTGGGNQVGNQIFEYEGFDIPFGTAEIMEIQSGDDEDGGAGTDTGALTMMVFGLDIDGNRIDEVITLNGVTVVDSSLSYWRVYRAFVITAGSTGTNQGKITITSKVSGFRLSQIDNGSTLQNQTLQATYTIPVNYYGLLTSIFASISKKSVATECDIEGYVRPLGGVFQLRLRRGLMTFGSNHFNFDTSSVPTFIPQLSDIKARSGIPSGSGLGMTAGFSILCTKIDPNIPG